MSQLLPHRPSVEHTPRSRDAYALQDETTSAILSALQSETAREIVNALGDNPATATDLAGLIGTSPQNVHHHLDQLSAAGIIDAVDTWYSERGVEMKVYDLRTEHLRIDLTAESPPEAPRPAQVPEHE